MNTATFLSLSRERPSSIASVERRRFEAGLQVPEEGVFGSDDDGTFDVPTYGSGDGGDKDGGDADEFTNDDLLAFLRASVAGRSGVYARSARFARPRTHPPADAQTRPNVHTRAHMPPRIQLILRS